MTGEEQPGADSWHPNGGLPGLLAMARAMGELMSSMPADACGPAGDALEAIGALLPVADQLTTVLAQLIAQAEIDDLFRLDGSTSILAYLTANLPVARQRAKTHAGIGRALRDHLPSARAAMQTGILGWDAGADLAQHATSSQARIDALDHPVPADANTTLATQMVREALAAGSAENPTAVPGSCPESTAELPPGWVRCEDWLVAKGIELTAAQFRKLLNYWASMVDPDAHERTYQENEADSYIAAGQTMDCCHVQGKLAPEGGKIFQAALEAFRPAYEAEHPTGIEERNAEALVTIARIALETNVNSESAAVRPHIGVTISWETFVAMATNAGIPADQVQAMGALPPAMWADDTSAIPHSLMATMACDSDITRIVFGPAGQVINLGRTRRAVSPGLRAAIVARDTHCVYPRCDAPPVLCQVHHVDHWSNGGRTDVDNLALLCGRHHRWIHANGITIRPANRAADRTTDTGPPGRTPPASSLDPGRTPPASSPAERATRVVQGTLLDARPAYDFIDRHGQPIGQSRRWPTPAGDNAHPNPAALPEGSASG